MENESLSNDQIQVTIHKKPHCLVELDIIAQPDLIEKSHRQAVKEVSKEVSIPGFRKGKAPADLILKKFSRNVEERSHKFLAQNCFQQCKSLTAISPFSQDSKVSFEVKNYSKESAEVIFNFETYPDVPNIDYAQFKIDFPEESPLDPHKLEETLRKIRFFFAKWQEVKDRGVQMGDFVILDLDTIEEDGSEKRIFSNNRLEISQEHTAQWMLSTILDMKPEETKETISQPDEDASEEDKKHFTPKKVKVTLKSIEEPILPPVDDDLAKKVGVESAAIMKERLSYLLEKQEKEQKQKALRETLSEQMTDLYTFDLPQSLLEKETTFRLEQLLKNPAEKKRFKSLPAEEKRAELEKIKNYAEKSIRLFFLCQKIISDNNLTFSLDDATKDIKSPLDAMFVDRDVLNPQKTEDQKAILTSRLMLSTAEDFILNQIQQTSQNQV